jgi:hypothetical protein
MRCNGNGPHFMCRPLERRSAVRRPGGFAAVNQAGCLPPADQQSRASTEGETGRFEEIIL